MAKSTSDKPVAAAKIDFPVLQTGRQKLTEAYAAMVKDMNAALAKVLDASLSETKDKRP